MSKHLIWLAMGFVSFACGGPGSSDDDDDDGGESGDAGNESGGTSGSGTGGARGGTGGSTGGTGGSGTGGARGGTGGTGGSNLTGMFCGEVEGACICVPSTSSSDTCPTPKPTCCFEHTSSGSCSCYPEDDPVCILRGLDDYPAVSTCPSGAAD